MGCLNPVDLAQDAFSIIVIATYAVDEPILSIIDAAGMLQGRVILYVTGDYTRLDSESSYQYLTGQNISARISHQGSAFWVHLAKQV